LIVLSGKLIAKRIRDFITHCSQCNDWKFSGAAAQL